MLEQRKLKVVCFKARLTKNLESLTLTIDTQLLTESPNPGEFLDPHATVRMFQYPELHGGVMYLKGTDLDESNTVSQRYSDVDTAFEIQTENLRKAGWMIRQYMEQGYYGEGRKCQA